MFIELTDHLRCPGPHPEAYLVLLPDRMEGRRVLEGSLGCPICARVIGIRASEVLFGEAPASLGPTGLDPEGAHALMGIDGPGGFIALVGGATALAAGLAERLPGVHFALVNPPEHTPSSATQTVLRAPSMPLKRASMRSVILGPDIAGDPLWLAPAVATVLPGNRAVGEGPTPDLPNLEVLAEAGGLWTGRVGLGG